jgi:hypothetical protein
LSINAIASSETLRQRMNLAGNHWREIILEENIRMLQAMEVDLTPCLTVLFLKESLNWRKS